jgi:hypothetical protein
MINGSNALKLENNKYENYVEQQNKTLHRRKHKWRVKQSYKMFYSILGNIVGLLLTMLSILFLVFSIGY